MKGFGNHLALALSCAASVALSMPAHAQISDNVVRVGVLNDISGIFQDTNGMGSVEAARMAAEDFNGGGQEHQGRDRLCRSPEQGRRRAGDRAQMARRRRRRRHRRRAEFGRRPFHQCAAAGFADDVPGVVHRQLRSHRQGLFAQHHPVGQRRLGDRQHDRGGDDGARRQGLVLRHGRLRARQGYRGGSHQLHREARRQGAGFEQASARHLGFRLLPAAGAEFQIQSDRPCQCRRRHHQRGQAGHRVRHPAERPDAWWRSCCSSTTSTAWG